MTDDTTQWLAREEYPEVGGIRFETWGSRPNYHLLAEIMNEGFKADSISHFANGPELENYYGNLPEFSPERDGYLVYVLDQAVGWASLQPRDEAHGDMVYRLYHVVVPEWRSKGIGEALLTLAENRARQRAEGLPPNRASCFEISFSESQQAGIARVEKRGYQPTRYFFFMTRPLDEPIENHPLPSGYDQRPVTEEDLRPIWEAHHKAFEEHWGHPEVTEEHFQMFIDNPLADPDLWQVAWYDGEVAGMVLNFVDEEENRAMDRRRGYTEDIAVVKRHRQKGLAKSLIAKSMQMFKQMGMEETALAVDTENASGALRLYQKLGYRTERKSTAFRKPIA